jgi:hypothetical protein
VNAVAKFDDVELAFAFVSSEAHKNDLGLGKPLGLKFVAQALPDEVAAIFQRRGAYGRFKDLLKRRGKLDEWYEFENYSQREALREWCAANGIEVEG